MAAAPLTLWSQAIQYCGKHGSRGPERGSGVLGACQSELSDGGRYDAGREVGVEAQPDRGPPLSGLDQVAERAQPEAILRLLPGVRAQDGGAVQ
jgi:hypothetical protein